jgi:hypothetical protein
MGTDLEGELRGAKDTALQQSESSRKHRQIKILERFDSAVSQARESARAIAVNAPSPLGKRARDRLFRYVQFDGALGMFGASVLRLAASPAAASARRGACEATDARRCASVYIVPPADAGRSRCVAARQPAFIDCL